MKIAIISPSTQSLENLAALLTQNNASRQVTIHEGGLSKLRSVAEQTRPHIVIIEGLCSDAGDLGPVEALTSQYPDVFIILLCTQSTPQTLVNAMRVGVRDVLISPVDEGALESAVARIEATAQRRRDPHAAQFLAFIPSKGGSGATFLATNIAHELGGEGKKVLLLDLNLQHGDAVLTIHDCKASNDIVGLTRNLSRLDPSFLNASALHVTPNFAILAAPDDPGHALEVEAVHLDVILDLAMTMYDFVIMDLSREFSELTIRALDRANKIFLIVQGGLPYLRNANRMMTEFAVLGYPHEKMEILVNRVSRNDAISVDNLRSSLHVDALRSIPNGYREVAKAINLGMPLSQVSASSPVYRAIRDIARSFEPASVVRPSLLQRFMRN